MIQYCFYLPRSENFLLVLVVAKPMTVGWTMSPYVAVTPGLQEAGNQVPLLDRRNDSDTRTGHHPITEACKSQQV